MIARLLKILLLALLASALAWASAWVSAGRGEVALLGFIVLITLHPAVLGIEFAWMATANRHDPAPPSTHLQRLRAWWGEVCAATRAFGWEQPFRHGRWPDRLPPNRGRAGLILVHGYFCNRAVWNAWLRRLNAHERPFVAVTLEPPFGSIDGMVQTLEDTVHRMEQATGCAPVIVAHSMGGLVARAWWSRWGRPGRVRRILTLGTPHHGTLTARLGLGVNTRQMRPDSDWLSTLRRAESRLPPPLTCFFSHCDNIVFPSSTACMPGADNRHLEAVAHVRMVEHPDVWHEAMRLLNLPEANPHD